MRKSATLEISFFQQNKLASPKPLNSFELVQLDNNCYTLSSLTEYEVLYCVLSDWMKMYKTPENLELTQKSYSDLLSSKKMIHKTYDSDQHLFSSSVPREEVNDITLDSINMETFIDDDEKRSQGISFVSELEEIWDNNTKNEAKFERIVLDDDRIYEGYILDGKKNGFGCIMCKDGSKYIGLWRNDQKNGKGFSYFPSSGYYYGDWADDFPEGMGEYKYSDGEIYTGNIKNG